MKMRGATRGGRAATGTLPSRPGSWKRECSLSDPHPRNLEERESFCSHEHANALQPPTEERERERERVTVAGEISPALGSGASFIRG
jgi:hypothetical protein